MVVWQKSCMQNATWKCQSATCCFLVIHSPDCGICIDSSMNQSPLCVAGELTCLLSRRAACNVNVNHLLFPDPPKILSPTLYETALSVCHRGTDMCDSG